MKCEICGRPKHEKGWIRAMFTVRKNELEYEVLCIHCVNWLERLVNNVGYGTPSLFKLIWHMETIEKLEAKEEVEWQTH